MQTISSSRASSGRRPVILWSRPRISGRREARGAHAQGAHPDWDARFRIRTKSYPAKRRGTSTRRRPCRSSGSRSARRRSGISSTLARVLQPAYEDLGRYRLQAPVVGADEIWWRLMDNPAAKRWWVWSYARRRVVYALPAGRAGVLAGYTGIVMADVPLQPCGRIFQRLRALEFQHLDPVPVRRLAWIPRTQGSTQERLVVSGVSAN